MSPCQGERTLTPPPFTHTHTLSPAQVLGKFPVVQHLVFGPLFPCTWTPACGGDASALGALSDTVSYGHAGTENPVGLGPRSVGPSVQAAPWATTGMPVGSGMGIDAGGRAPWAMSPGGMHPRANSKYI